MPASNPDPDDEVTLHDLGEHPPLAPKPEWTPHDTARLKDIETKLREVMRNRRNRR